MEETLDGQTFRWDGKRKRVALLGPHQLHNTATVLHTVDALRARGWKVPEEAVDEGLANVKWPARLEVLSRDPVFLLDGGHNPQCAEALAAAIDKLFPDKKVIFLLGVLADKDYPQIMDIVMPYAKKFYCMTPFSPRALPAEQLRDYLKERGADAVSYDSDLERGIRAALKAAGKRGAVVAFGSLYLAGHVRTAWQQMQEQT